MDDERFWKNINHFSFLLERTNGIFANIPSSYRRGSAPEKAKRCLEVATPLMEQVLHLIAEADLAQKEATE